MENIIIVYFISNHYVSKILSLYHRKKQPHSKQIKNKIYLVLKMFLDKHPATIKKGFRIIDSLPTFFFLFLAHQIANYLISIHAKNCHRLFELNITLQYHPPPLIHLCFLTHVCFRCNGIFHGCSVGGSHNPLKSK